MDYEGMWLPILQTTTVANLSDRPSQNTIKLDLCRRPQTPQALRWLIVVFNHAGMCVYRDACLQNFIPSMACRHQYLENDGPTSSPAQATTSG